MKIRTILTTLVLAVGSYALACTNFLVGKNASADGSTMISYAADSYCLYGFLRYQPAADHQPGDMRKVYDWDTNKFLCEIPEVAHTYSVIGNMNEHQLTIGETTFGGRHEIEQDSTGLIDYGSLIYIALERCKTAREAIVCMTDLVAQYGYYSEGESFSIGDPEEVWILEMIGKGHGSKSAVWVATRIPDDCISAHANQARITNLPVADKAKSNKKAKYEVSKDGNWMWSKDVISFARQMGYFKGEDKDFSFAEAYCPLDLTGAYGCEGRVWAFFRKFDRSMDQYLPYVMSQSTEKMPLAIRPDHKLSAQDLKYCMRDQYEGTPLSIRDAAGSGPWKSKLRYGGLTFKQDSTEYCYPRPTATQQTAWSFVAQMRSWVPQQVGGIFWFGLDDAATTVYVPFYSSTNHVPYCMQQGNGDLLTYSPTSTFWAFNFVANWSYSKYSAMYPEIQQRQAEWEKRLNEQVQSIDEKAAHMDAAAAQKMQTQMSCEQAELLTQDWHRLFEYLMVRYLDGQEKKVKDGRFQRNELGEPEYPSRPAFPQEYLETIKSGVHHD